MAHRTKSCKFCKDRFEVKKGLQTPRGFFCSTDHAIEYAKSAQTRSLQAKKSKNIQTYMDSSKGTHKAVLESRKKCLKWQHKQTQKAFNRMRVLEELQWFEERGLEPTCISCGNGLGNDQWCCGHYKTRGASSHLRYDRKNTYLQHNNRCNMHLSGDIGGTSTTRGYKLGILERFNKVEGQKILDHCEQSAVIKWTCEELEAMRKEFNYQIKLLTS